MFVKPSIRLNICTDRAVSDSAAHLSEEVKTAAKSVPKAMMWSFVLNGIVGFVVLVSFLFAVPDIGAALDPATNPSGFVFLYVFQQASYHGSIPLTVMIIMVVVAGIIDSNCSTSRQVFAFARDGGFPFRTWLAKVHMFILDVSLQSFAYQDTGP